MIRAAEGKRKTKAATAAATKKLIIIIIIIIVVVWKLFVYACQIVILETFVCLILTANVETALPLNALRRQMPSTVTLIYSVDVLSPLMVG